MKIFSILTAVVFCAISWADDLHYRDIIIGERAAGLGGAYIAISDDPSGIWHNPAGIMFSFENYFSLSANAYTETSEVYKQTIASGDYKYTSSSLVPSFFGFTQNLGKHKWGFAIVVPNSDSIDQDDFQGNISTTAGAPSSFLRKFSKQNTTTCIGPAFATELIKNFTFGVSGFLTYHSDRTIDNQLVLYNADNLNKEKYFIQNTSYTKKIFSFLPKLGIQYMPMTNLSIGAVYSKKMHISGEKKLKQYRTALDSNNVPVDNNYNLGHDLYNPDAASTSAVDISSNEIGLGLAYYPNKQFLLSSDFYYYTDDSSYKEHQVKSTWNWSVGTEYYFSESSAIRAGFYTNNANTPVLSNQLTDQATHVDMNGLTLSYSFLSSGSSFTIGGIYSSGNGKGQAIGGTTRQQEVIKTSTTVYLTGSYQM